MSLGIKYCCEKTDLREFIFSDHKSFMDQFSVASNLFEKEEEKGAEMIQWSNEQ
jgi:hypothetical protein